MASEPIIRLAGITKTYNAGEVSVRALVDVDLTIQNGEMVAIMGPSGSGKSTLMNVLGCLDRPTKGSYAFEGREVAELPKRELSALRLTAFGFVFQGFQLIARTSALDNVALPLVYADVPAGERRERAMEALGRVGLAGREDHTPAQLSGGQQQRVAIARALVNRPRLILADEPTGALDTRTSMEVLGLLQSLHKTGITIVIVTHEPDIAAYADRRIVVRDGRILSDEKQTPHDAMADLAAAPDKVGSVSAVATIIPLAFGALRRNKLRSALTALGVIIGVGALIVTVASGEGSKAVLEEQLATLGTNLLIVLPGSSTLGGARGGPGTGKPLTHGDLLAIAKGTSAARYAAPVDRTVVQVVLDNQNWLTTIYGSTPDFFAIRQWTVARGRIFNSSESDSGAKVCVIGQTVATQLFGVGDPMGQVVRVRGMPCEVVGVLEGKGQSSQGQDQDDLVVMPWVTFKSRMMSQDRIHVGSILVSAVSPDEVSHAQTQVTGVLRQQHRQPDGELDDFTVRNLADLAATQEKAADAQTAMLRNVAAVSLLVGGIGIMNIMLVSVTERTREIGIRLAIGASENKVLLQFLVEAVVLSAAGGLIGIALGLGGAVALASAMGWPFVLSPFWIFVAFGISMAIGVIFGFYPARKAAQMNPIDALRFE